MSFQLPDPDALGSQCPAERYLASLGTAVSRKGTTHAMNIICDLAGMEKVTQKVKRKGVPRNVTYKTFPWRDVRLKHREWIMERAEAAHYAPSSLNRLLAVFSGVFDAQREMGILTAAEYEATKAIKWYKRPPQLATPQKHPLTLDDFTRMLEARRFEYTEVHRVRNDAILWLLWKGGLRRAELAAIEAETEVGGKKRLEGLTLDCYDEPGKTLVVTLKGKTRLVPLDGGAADALNAWLALRGRRTGAIFVRINKMDGVMLKEPLSPHAIYNIVMKRAARANPPVEHMTVHRLRHNFITTLHNRGVPMGKIAKLAGHSSVAVTQTYFNPDELDLRAAVRLMPEP